QPPPLPERRPPGLLLVGDRRQLLPHSPAGPVRPGLGHSQALARQVGGLTRRDTTTASRHYFHARFAGSDNRMSNAIQPDNALLRARFNKLYRQFFDRAEKKRRWSISDDIPW